jgi:hypothetical protein
VTGRVDYDEFGLFHENAAEWELLHQLPSAQVVHVEQAGHSLQGDTPLELAAIIEGFVFSS